MAKGDLIDRESHSAMRLQNLIAKSIDLSTSEEDLVRVLGRGVSELERLEIRRIAGSLEHIAANMKAALFNDACDAQCLENALHALVIETESFARAVTRVQNSEFRRVSSSGIDGAGAMKP